MFAISAANAVLVPTVYEDFSSDTDLYWDGNGNRSNPGSNDYGWSDTDNTGDSVIPVSGNVSKAGELGLYIQRGNSSDYGFDTGAITPTDMFHADGVYQWIDGSGNWFFGFYNQADHVTAGGDPRNFIGFQLDDSRAVYVHNARSDHNDRTHSGPQQLPNAETVAWSIDYDGNGLTTFVINGVTINHNSGAGYFTGGGGGPTVFDRFGLFPGPTSDSVGVIAMDDITFSSHNPIPDDGVIPEPSTLLIVLCCAAGLIPTRRRS
jgi:hypothetical protein